jgi:hypothetical protein
MVSCCSTSCSVGGPTKLIVAPSFCASCSAPFFTACQNWCWKPLDTMAMLGAPPPPAADPPPELLEEEPQALSAAANPTAVINVPNRRNRI